MLAFIIFSIVFAPLASIFFTFLSPNPSTSRSLKNFIIVFSITRGSVLLFNKTISIFVAFQTYSYSVLFGIKGVCAGTSTSAIYGITSPLRINLTNAPNPILLSFINFALNPVAYVIDTPPIVTGSNWTRGLISPFEDTVHNTSTTFASISWSVNTILKANACSGFLLTRGYTLSSIHIIPSIE